MQRNKCRKHTQKEGRKDAYQEIRGYLHLFGLVALAYMWALMAKTAQEKIAGGAADPIYGEKLAVGRYYIARVLPETAGRLAKLKTGAETLMALPADAF